MVNTKPSRLLTGPLYRHLKKSGYILNCWLCAEPVRLGDEVVIDYSRRNKKISHARCAEAYEAGTLTKKRLLPTPLGYKSKSPTPHVVLRRGECVSNPHPRVLCPSLQNGGLCKKRDKYHEFLRPELLLAHHARANLELWQCEGCKDFLLRVEKDAS